MLFGTTPFANQHALFGTVESGPLEFLTPWKDFCYPHGLWGDEVDNTPVWAESQIDNQLWSEDTPPYQAWTDTTNDSQRWTVPKEDQRNIIRCPE